MLEFLLLIGLAVTAALQEPTAPLDNVCSPGSGINLRKTRIIAIGPGFVDRPTVTCLDLKDNSIETVAAGAFDSLPNLKQLYLSNNQINSLTELLSSSMTHLEALNLTKTRQSSSSATQHITGSFPALRDFSLSHNFIKTIIAKNQPFPKLERLELSGNRLNDMNSISTIAPSTLKLLNASSNELMKLTGKDWSNLATLDLSNNKFNGIAYNYVGYSNVTLVGLKNLRKLLLRKCIIYTIYDDAFADTANLEILDLQMNRLSSDNIPPDAFSPLKSLKVLLLRHNPLKEMPRFQTLSPLTTFDLGNTALSLIPADAFWWASRLKLLRLDNNYIQTVHPTTFLGLQSLEVLDLEANLLSTLPPGWCSDLINLRYLDLKNNKFASFESVEMNENVPLHYLFFEGNQLSLVKSSSLNSMPRNVTINLNYNRPIVDIPDTIIE